MLVHLTAFTREFQRSSRTDLTRYLETFQKLFINSHNLMFSFLIRCFEKLISSQRPNKLGRWKLSSNWVIFEGCMTLSCINAEQSISFNTCIQLTEYCSNLLPFIYKEQSFYLYTRTHFNEYFNFHVFTNVIKSEALQILYLKLEQ